MRVQSLSESVQIRCLPEVEANLVVINFLEITRYRFYLVMVPDEDIFFSTIGVLLTRGR